VDRVGGWHWLLFALTWLSATIARAVGVSAVQSGTLIVLENRTLSIDLPCSALFIMALFAALVLAYPVSPAQRLRGLALGLPVIAVFNVIVAAARVSVPCRRRSTSSTMFQSGMVLVTAIVLGLVAVAGTRCAIRRCSPYRVALSTRPVAAVVTGVGRHVPAARFVLPVIAVIAR
jgi:exosortase/archaeosortase family protein